MVLIYGYNVAKRHSTFPPRMHTIWLSERASLRNRVGCIKAEGFTLLEYGWKRQCSFECRLVPDLLLRIVSASQEGRPTDRNAHL